MKGKQVEFNITFFTVPQLRTIVNVMLNSTCLPFIFQDYGLPATHACHT